MSIMDLLLGYFGLSHYVWLQGILNVDDDVEEEFEVDINEAEPQFLQGQSSRSGVEVRYILRPSLGSELAMDLCRLHQACFRH